MDKEQKVKLMGKIVTVTAEYAKRRHDTQVRYAREIRKVPRAGWVVGFRNYREGNWTYTQWNIDGDDGDYFTPTKNVPAMLVSYWPDTNPVRVPLDAFMIGGEPVRRLVGQAYTVSWNINEAREKDEKLIV